MIMHPDEPHIEGGVTTNHHEHHHSQMEQLKDMYGEIEKEKRILHGNYDNRLTRILELERECDEAREAYRLYFEEVSPKLKAERERDERVTGCPFGPAHYHIKPKAEDIAELEAALEGENR